MRHLERSKRPLRGTRILMMTSAVALMAASAAITAPAFADEAAAKKWIDSEFQPSTLSKDDQMKEMQWFIKAAAPFKGMEINAVSETLTVHEYESKTLAKAFEEITGIKVKHDIIQEGDVVEKIQTQMQSGKNVYDGWINDSDFIGTHFRYGQTRLPHREMSHTLTRRRPKDDVVDELQPVGFPSSCHPSYRAADCYPGGTASH